MSQGPWSVKGIAPQARSIARERAQKRGVTLGQYLNTLLLDDQPVEADGATTHPRSMLIETERPEDLRELSEEINRLAARLEQAQSRSSRAIAGIDKSILSLTGRIDETGKAQLGALERVTRVVADIESAQTTLRDRIGVLERDITAGPTVDALKGLEASLERLADSVSLRSSAIEQDQLELRDLFEDRVTSVAEKVDTFTRNFDQTLTSAVRTSTSPLNDRVGQIESHLATVERKMETAIGRISDAASRFEMFESKAERAVSDTTWRMERALETSVQRSRALSKELSDKLDTVEERTRSAVDALGSSVARVIDRLERSERNTEQAVKTVERSVLTLDERIGRISATLEQDSARLQSDLHNRMEALAQDLARPIQTIRRDFELKLEQAVVSASPESLSRLEKTLSNLQSRLEASEARQADVVETISSQVQRLSDAVNSRIESIDRGDSRALNDLRSELAALTQKFNGRIEETEKRNIHAIDKLSGQLSAVADHLQRRNDDAVEALSKRIDAGAGMGGQEFEKFVERIDDRVRSSERRSAAAIEQIGEQVARVAERLQNQQRETLKSLEDRVEEAGRVHEARLADTLSDVIRRLDDLGEASDSALNPIRNTMSSLAMRVSSLEDRDAPATEPQPARAASREAPPELEEFAHFLAAAQDNELDVSPQSEIFEADDSIVGVEPPPFDRSAHEALFQEPAPFKELDDADLSAGAVTAEPSAAPASRIDDLLDADDDLLEPAPHANYVASLPNAPIPDSPQIAEARQAARFGRDIRLTTQESVSRRGVGHGPLVASAALAIAVAGGGGYALWRGKQDAGAEAAPREEPPSPHIAEGDPEAAAAALFDEHASIAESPTVAAAPSDAPPADDEFQQTSLVTAEAKAQAAQAKASAPGQASATASPPAPKAPSLMDAVRAGDAVALHDYAVELLKGPEKSRAVLLLKEAAGKGLVMAQYRIAKLYERGEGVPRDMAASRKWAEQAAIGGNIKAMHDLAVFYAEGDAGPQSYAAAVEWFRQAADHGLVDSQYNLAVLYEQGLGVSEDKAEAAFWFEIAARNGDQDAGRRSRALLSELDPAKAEETRRRARAFNARPGDAKANGDLGQRPWETVSLR